MLSTARKEPLPREPPDLPTVMNSDGTYSGCSEPLQMFCSPSSQGLPPARQHAMMAVCATGCLTASANIASPGAWPARDPSSHDHLHNTRHMSKTLSSLSQGNSTQGTTATTPVNAPKGQPDSEHGPSQIATEHPSLLKAWQARAHPPRSELPQDTMCMPQGHVSTALPQRPPTVALEASRPPLEAAASVGGAPARRRQQTHSNRLHSRHLGQLCRQFQVCLEGQSCAVPACLRFPFRMPSSCLQVGAGFKRRNKESPQVVVCSRAAHCGVPAACLMALVPDKQC
jgi:hypothetical protein